jgi:type VI secretion system secreted protein Hcp
MANFDAFLKIDGVQGESLDSKHTNEIELLGYGWGESQSGSFSSNQGGGSGKVHFQDFHFTMPVNSASPPLFLKCATGEHIASATLTIRKAGKEQQEYLKYEFKDLLVSSYQTGGSASSGVLPTDQITFNYTQVKVTYRPQQANGSLGGPLTGCYNIKQQATC